VVRYSPALAVALELVRGAPFWRVLSLIFRGEENVGLMGFMLTAALAILTLWQNHHVYDGVTREYDDVTSADLEGVDPFDPLASSRRIDELFPHLGGFITRLCFVESACRRPIGVHKIDSWAGRKVYRRAMARGLLNATCHWHKSPEDPSAEWYAGWSTSGNHGMMTAYNVQYLGSCAPREAFAVPLLSALAAARKASGVCRGNVTCTDKRLRCHWASAEYGSEKCEDRWGRWARHLSMYARELKRLGRREDSATFRMLRGLRG
jgi:hypothetical protein